MSIASLTSLAAARDVGPPTKQDVGKGTSAAPGAPASLTNLLVTQVPTELVAPYTAVTAGIVGLVGKTTTAGHAPDQLAVWRWAAFAILIIGTIGLTWEGKRRKSDVSDIPVLEITGAVIAATGWALALPMSPLGPYLHSTAGKTLTPLMVAFGAIVAASLTASGLQGQRGGTPAADDGGGGAPPVSGAESHATQ